MSTAFLCLHASIEKVFQTDLNEAFWDNICTYNSIYIYTSTVGTSYQAFPFNISIISLVPNWIPVEVLVSSSGFHLLGEELLQDFGGLQLHIAQAFAHHGVDEVSHQGPRFTWLDKLKTLSITGIIPEYNLHQFIEMTPHK